MEMFHGAFFKLCSQVSAAKRRSTSANPAPVSTMARAPTRSAATTASVLQVRWAPASFALQPCLGIALVSRQKKTQNAANLFSNLCAANVAKSP